MPAKSKSQIMREVLGTKAVILRPVAIKPSTLHGFLLPMKPQLFTAEADRVPTDLEVRNLCGFQSLKATRRRDTWTVVDLKLNKVIGRTKNTRTLHSWIMVIESYIKNNR